MALNISLCKALMYAGIAMNVARIALIPACNIETQASPPTQENEAVRQLQAADALPGDLRAVPAVMNAGISINVARVALSPADPTETQASPPIQETEPVQQFAAAEALRDDLRAVLESIPTGREALRILEKFDVEIRFESSPGSYFKTPENFVVMGWHESTEAAALTFVHEMLHADWYNTGLAPNEMALSRASYVQQRVGEETEAVLRGIRASSELRQAGLDSPGTPLEPAHQQAVKQALRDVPMPHSLGSEGMAELATQAGTQRVIAAFMNGEVVGASTGMTYPQSSGEYWDRVRDAA